MSSKDGLQIPCLQDLASPTNLTEADEDVLSSCQHANMSLTSAASVSESAVHSLPACDTAHYLTSSSPISVCLVANLTESSPSTTVSMLYEAHTEDGLRSATTTATHAHVPGMLHDTREETSSATLDGAADVRSEAHLQTPVHANSVMEELAVEDEGQEDSDNAQQSRRSGTRELQAAAGCGVCKPSLSACAEAHATTMSGTTNECGDRVQCHGWTQETHTHTSVNTTDDAKETVHESSRGVLDTAAPETHVRDCETALVNDARDETSCAITPLPGMCEDKANRHECDKEGASHAKESSFARLHLSSPSRTEQHKAMPDADRDVHDTTNALVSHYSLHESSVHRGDASAAAAPPPPPHYSTASRTAHTDTLPRRLHTAHARSPAHLGRRGGRRGSCSAPDGTRTLYDADAHVYRGVVYDDAVHADVHATHTRNSRKSVAAARDAMHNRSQRITLGAATTTTTINSNSNSGNNKRHHNNSNSGNNNNVPAIHAHGASRTTRADAKAMTAALGATQAGLPTLSAEALARLHELSGKSETFCPPAGASPSTTPMSVSTTTYPVSVSPSPAAHSSISRCMSATAVRHAFAFSCVSSFCSTSAAVAVSVAIFTATWCPAVPGCM